MAGMAGTADMVAMGATADTPATEDTEDMVAMDIAIIEATATLADKLTTHICPTSARSKDGL